VFDHQSTDPDDNIGIQLHLSGTSEGSITATKSFLDCTVFASEIYPE
jgi:hypothetical protein